MAAMRALAAYTVDSATPSSTSGPTPNAAMP